MNLRPKEEEMEAETERNHGPSAERIEGYRECWYRSTSLLTAIRDMAEAGQGDATGRNHARFGAIRDIAEMMQTNFDDAFSE